MARRLKWEDFVSKYKPIPNRIVKGAPCEGYMFETYGKELKFVKKHKVNKIFTLMDNDIILPGAHWVNRLGYFVTEVHWENKDLEFNC